MKGYIWYQRNKAYLKNAMIFTGDKLYVSEVLGHALTTSRWIIKYSFAS